MKVVVHGDLGTFAEAVRPALLRDEALHNLPLGVLGQLERGVYDERTLCTVEDGGVVVGAALRTPPWPWAVARFAGDPAAVARVIGDHLARHTRLPGELTGERHLVAAVADRWAVATDGAASVHMAMRVLDCTEVVVPRGIRGAPRPITAADVDEVAGWLVAFEEETGVTPDPRPAEEVHRLVATAVEQGRSPLHVWEADGSVVSLAGIGRPTGTGERVGPVYTPPGLRGRGHAGALVAHLTADALARGRRHVFLFTDADNPVSNALYERLGYRHVADAATHTVTPRP